MANAGERINQKEVEVTDEVNVPGEEKAPEHRKVKVTIKAIEGRPCKAGLQVGQSWVLDQLTPEGMCPYAYLAIFSTWQIMRYGGMPPALHDGVVVRSCPDPKALVLFQVEPLP